MHRLLLHIKHYTFIYIYSGWIYICAVLVCREAPHSNAYVHTNKWDATHTLEALAY
jgi:hypothetical protein